MHCFSQILSRVLLLCEEGNIACALFIHTFYDRASEGPEDVCLKSPRSTYLPTPSQQISRRPTAHSSGIQRRSSLWKSTPGDKRDWVSPTAIFPPLESSIANCLNS